MVLQSSGRISLGDVAGEFGGIVPHKLSEYWGVAIGVPATNNTIRISDFYGKSNNPDPPTWITAADFGLYQNSTSFSKTVKAYSDSNVTLSSVSIPFGSFSVSGNTATLSGTTPNVSKTTYTWTIRATDEELQTTDRDFTMIVSKVPSFSTASDLGSYSTSTSFGLYLSASSDSSVTFSMQVASWFGTVQSNGYFYGTTPGYGGTFTWTIRATDQEGQYADRQFSMTVVQPQLIQHGIAGTWGDSNGQIYVYNSIYYLNDSTSGYFTYNNRPAFTLTVAGENVISMYFPDAGTITGVVTQVGGTWYISQNNGTSWRR